MWAAKRRGNECWPMQPRSPVSAGDSRDIRASVFGLQPLYGDNAGHEAVQADTSRDKDSSEHNRLDDRKCSLFLLQPGDNEQSRSRPVENGCQECSEAPLPLHQGIT